MFSSITSWRITERLRNVQLPQNLAMWWNTRCIYQVSGVAWRIGIDPANHSFLNMRCKADFWISLDQGKINVSCLWIFSSNVVRNMNLKLDQGYRSHEPFGEHKGFKYIPSWSQKRYGLCIGIRAREFMAWQASKITMKQILPIYLLLYGQNLTDAIKLHEKSFIKAWFNYSFLRVIPSRYYYLHKMMGSVCRRRSPREVNSKFELVEATHQLRKVKWHPFFTVFMYPYINAVV